MSSSLSVASESQTQSNPSNMPVKVTLEIENFSTETNCRYKAFSLSNQINFRLICYPQYKNNLIGLKYTTIYLFLNSCNQDKVTVRYQIWLLNADGDKCDSQERIETFSSSSCGGLWLINYDHLAKPEFLHSGKLSIYCEIEEIDSTNPHFIQTNIIQNPILQDYQTLLDNTKFSDASLIVSIGKKSFLVHKAILSARSRVFSAMFENDCEEKRQNRVEITDISAEVCQQMLNYIYSGTIPEMNKYAGDLFVAADKYQLDHLKSVCEQHLCSKINIDNVATTLLLADMHQASLLKPRCIDFIVKHGDRVVASEGWKTLTKDRPELVIPLFERIVKKR